jgi:phosphoglycolate phosphatase-like HAD superfamily hydrolase
VQAEYSEFSSREGDCYVRETSLGALKEVDVVVFDCDGVLLDVRDSYSGAVAETASIILEALTGTRIEPSVFDDDVFFAFKKTGQFNGDWTVTYAYVLGALSTLTDGELSSLAASAGKVGEGSPSERLSELSRIRSPSGLHAKCLKTKLIELAESVGAGGVGGLEVLLIPRIGTEVRDLLRFRDGVGVSVISTLFEEVFGGAGLFEETFGFPAQFIEEKLGHIEKEKVVLNASIIPVLEEQLGGRRLGIASGSLRNSAWHALGGLVELFPRDAQVWHEDVDSAQAGKENLHKPNGYPLLRAAGFYSPYKRCVYVGDTMADLLTARSAGERDPKFCFVGVYATATQPMVTKEMFLSSGVDAVVPTVNHLPLVLDYARRRTRD